jgi:hypothetical protein
VAHSASCERLKLRKSHNCFRHELPRAIAPGEFRLLEGSCHVAELAAPPHLTNVWSGCALQEGFVELAVSGLASIYPAFDWSSMGFWPSWISARVRSPYRTGLSGPSPRVPWQINSL